MRFPNCSELRNYHVISPYISRLSRPVMELCSDCLEMYSSAASYQLKLDVRWIDAAEHGNMLGGQLWREHTSPDSCHSSHAANTPHAPAGRGHLLQHGAWHLETDTTAGRHTCYHRNAFGAVTTSNHISLLLLPD